MRDARPISLAELIARAVSVAVARIEARHAGAVGHARIISAPRRAVSRKLSSPTGNQVRA